LQTTRVTRDANILNKTTRNMTEYRIRTINPQRIELMEFAPKLVRISGLLRRESSEICEWTDTTVCWIRLSTSSQFCYSPVLRMNGRVMFCRWFFFIFTSLISEMRQRRQGNCCGYGVYMCNFYWQVLVLGNPPPFLSGGKTGSSQITLGEDLLKLVEFGLDSRSYHLFYWNLKVFLRYKLRDRSNIFVRWRQQHKNGRVTLGFATHF